MRYMGKSTLNRGWTVASVARAVAYGLVAIIAGTLGALVLWLFTVCVAVACGGHL